MKEVEPPKDRRFIALVKCWGFSNRWGWQHKGWKWQEGWWNGKEFVQWCGNKATSSTGGFDIVGWVERPETYNLYDLEKVGALPCGVLRE